LSKYEEGSKLVKICQEKLAEADLRFSNWRKMGGRKKLKPFEKDVNREPLSRCIGKYGDESRFNNSAM